MNKHGDPIFLLYFFNVHIVNVNYAKFQKKFDGEQSQGNYLKLLSNVHQKTQLTVEYIFVASC